MKQQQQQLTPLQQELEAGGAGWVKADGQLHSFDSAWRRGLIRRSLDHAGSVNVGGVVLPARACVEAGLASEQAVKWALERDEADKAQPVASIDNGEAQRAADEAFDSDPVTVAADRLAAFARSGGRDASRREAVQALRAAILSLIGGQGAGEAIAFGRRK
jgi:hypothetical protein